MDLKAYYRRIREVEQGFETDHATVVSLETPDGGKAGIKTEVPSQVAAKMIVEGRARAATEQEAAEFKARNSQAKWAADQADGSKRMQVTVVSEKDLRGKR
jgi:hypothetical protein